MNTRQLITDYVRDQIHALGVDGLLLTTNDLKARFGVGPGSVQAAYRVLIDEGLVEVRRIIPGNQLRYVAVALPASVDKGPTLVDAIEAAADLQRAAARLMTVLEQMRAAGRNPFG